MKKEITLRQAIINDFGGLSTFLQSGAISIAVGILWNSGDRFHDVFTGIMCFSVLTLSARIRMLKKDIE